MGLVAKTAAASHSGNVSRRGIKRKLMDRAKLRCVCVYVIIGYSDELPLPLHCCASPVEWEH